MKEQSTQEAILDSGIESGPDEMADEQSPEQPKLKKINLQKTPPLTQLTIVEDKDEFVDASDEHDELNDSKCPHCTKVLASKKGCADHIKRIHVNNTSRPYVKGTNFKQADVPRELRTSENKGFLDFKVWIKDFGSRLLLAL